MSTLPLNQQSLPDLVKLKTHLKTTRDNVAAIAKDLKMEPYFAGPLARIDEAFEEVEAEIAKR